MEKIKRFSEFADTFSVHQLPDIPDDAQGAVIFALQDIMCCFDGSDPTQVTSKVLHANENLALGSRGEVLGFRFAAMTLPAAIAGTYYR